jgi:hypothetical protein
VSKKATSQHLPQKRQHHNTAAKKHLSFIRFGRADPAQAVPKKRILPIYLATVSENEATLAFFTNEERSESRV